MQPTTLPLVCSLALLVGYAVAAPAVAAREECEPRILCVDGINQCGVRYGGCYDVCQTADKPVAPLCVSTATATATVIPTVTSTPLSITPSPIATAIPSAQCPGGSAGSGQSICYDAINECGRTYGGCFLDCRPWPSFTTPPCPAPTAPVPTLVTPTVIPTPV